MAVTVADVGAYLRLDDDVITDDTVAIQALINSALDYIRNTTGKTLDSSETPIYLFDLAVTMLSAHWYLNRGVVSDKSLNNIPYSVSSLIEFLSLSSAYE